MEIRGADPSEPQTTACAGSGWLDWVTARVASLGRGGTQQPLLAPTNVITCLSFFNLFLHFLPFQ